jgi:Tol biopolymer transport system component
VTIPQTTLWRLRIGESPSDASAPVKIQLATANENAPRFGPDYLVYVSSTGTSGSISKLANGSSTELWRDANAQIIGAPATSPAGRQIAFSVQYRGQKLLYVMQSDGSNARIIADSLDLQGDPAWTPDGQSITSAANERGVPHLFRFPVGGGSPTLFVREYALDPAWAPDGRFAIYSGPDIGTTFSLKAVTAEAATHPLPALTLTRDARHVALLKHGRTLVVLRGEVQHKDLWLIDLKTGAERQLTSLPADFYVRDFDISPDGSKVVLERIQERSELMVLELPHP